LVRGSLIAEESLATMPVMPLIAEESTKVYHDILLDLLHTSFTHL
jgi:hypothetical protein